LLQQLRPQNKIHAHQWFFLAACSYAILIVPLMMLARHNYGPAVLAMPSGHAFEMLFGFALALIAGYLLGPMPRWQLALFLFLWLLARITGLIASNAWLVLICNAVFAMLLAWKILPRLWVAKKWRNRMLIPLLGLICLFTIFTTLLNQLGYHGLHRYLLHESVSLFALLMLYMGGRMLAPAVAGEFYRQGKELQARVQPRIEAGLIVTVTAAFILAPISASVSGIFLIISGILACIRVFRWQLWRCRARPDLICLGIGYCWLTLGLILLGLVKLSGGDHLSTAIHAITVGALGTLASNVMVRVSLLHSKQYPSHIIQILAITGSMTFAAILRISADFSAYREIFLAISAAAWSTSFLLVFDILLDCLMKPPSRKSF
jgi:uncharacterized protein involved in response to NO